MKSADRRLRVFLCHASDDKPATRTLYASLKSVPWIDPWLDEENLLPGQDWDLEIYKATRDADAIIICLSTASVKKEGYVNKEIRHALDIAQEKPEGAIYVIPLRLDDCVPSFAQLKKLQWADYFTPNAHGRLLKSLRLRADTLKIDVPEITFDIQETHPPDDGLDLYRFIKIEPQETSNINYSFWIGKYPITNTQYERFLNAPDFANEIYWLKFPKFNEKFQDIGTVGSVGANWLNEQLVRAKSKILLPRYWNDKNFGKSNPNNPVVGITWYEASAYCEWLSHNWNSLLENKANLTVKPQSIRLPLESEWIHAGGGATPHDRYPWNQLGEITESTYEIVKRANVNESKIEKTTPVNQYPLGVSPYGVMDMAGNVWEWQANYGHSNDTSLVLRGGSWQSNIYGVRVSSRYDFGLPQDQGNHVGFRVVCIAN
ncbi:MAG: TIR domain-containing protein [Anaerolineaceae bacterium]|nr:MAG: TIR domain-containing protein [Anaerolineaceae bacterium]